MDAMAASGDDEVVLTASPPTSSSSPRRRRKRRRRTVSSAVPCVLVDMDTSEVEVPGHKQLKTFRGVWDDAVSWEELRARKPRYRVTVTLPEPSPPPPSPSQSISASCPTPVPPVSPVPSTFSSNGSVVDSVPTSYSWASTCCASLPLQSPAAWLVGVGSSSLSFCFMFAELLGVFGRSVISLGPSCFCC